MYDVKAYIIQNYFGESLKNGKRFKGTYRIEYAKYKTYHVYVRGSENYNIIFDETTMALLKGNNKDDGSET